MIHTELSRLQRNIQFLNGEILQGTISYEDCKENIDKINILRAQYTQELENNHQSPQGDLYLFTLDKLISNSS